MIDGAQLITARRIVLGQSEDPIRVLFQRQRERRADAQAAREHQHKGHPHHRAQQRGGVRLTSSRPVGEILSTEAIDRNAHTARGQADEHALMQGAAPERRSGEPIDGAKRRCRA